MKKLIVFLCLILMVPAFAEVEYKAKLKENGEYCARVRTDGPAGMIVTRMKCRSIAEWEKNGYTVTKSNKDEAED
jgi:hypothetical protein